MTTAAVYCRISHDPTGTRLGVERQEKDCRDLARRHGWEVAAVFVDNDASAYRGAKRPAFERLVDAMKAGDVGALVAWHPDRLTRHNRELEDLIDLVEATGVHIATVMAGEYDLSTATGRMSARIVGAVARHESEQKSERQRAKHRQLAEQGRWSGGGTRPFGYERDRRSLRVEEAELVREAARRVLAGESLRAICVDWGRRGVSTVTGAGWTMSVLRRILTTPTNAGLRALRGEVVAKGDWPAIIDEVSHARLRALLLDPERTINRFARRYLLSGFLRCGLCDARLVARPRGDKRRCYVCASGPGFHGCGKIRALSEPLEDEVTARIFATLADPRLARALELRASEADEQAAVNEISAAEGALAELARDYYTRRARTKVEYEAVRPELEHRLGDARRRLTALRRSDLVVAGDEPLPRRWPHMSIDQQRAVVDALVERVTVQPAVKGRNFFDPDRVVVSWRV